MSDIDKKEETLEAAAETGALDESTAEKLQEIMEKYDRESNVRKYRDRRKFCVIDEPRQYENLRLSQE